MLHFEVMKCTQMLISLMSATVPWMFFRIRGGATSRLNPDGQRHLVVFHTDPHIVLHGKLGGILDGRKDEVTNRERRRSFETEGDQIWNPLRRIHHVILPGKKGASQSIENILWTVNAG